jgi:hypothetical protein
MPKFGRFRQFSLKLTKVNNRPIGGMSPNLVTLILRVRDGGRIVSADERPKPAE